jgi:hypothetical protein
MPVNRVPFPDLLSQIVDNRGRTCPTADKGIPLIATNCIVNDRLFPVHEKVRHVSEETYNTWFRGHPEPGDIIFVCKGSPGNVAIAPDPVGFCIAQDMVAVRADPEAVYPRFLFAALYSRRNPAARCEPRPGHSVFKSRSGARDEARTHDPLNRPGFRGDSRDWFHAAGATALVAS